MKTIDIQPEKGVVQAMRRIREQLNREIQKMTFEEERVYLDKLLADKQPAGTGGQHVSASKE